MTAARSAWAADLLHYWFHELRPQQWFGRNDAVDRVLRCRFVPVLDRFVQRTAAAFLRDALTARAAILLFDQVPRNAFRDSPRAFATDPLARTITKEMIRKGWLRPLSRTERQFVLMPLMHSEDIADQRLSLRMFARNGDAGRRGFARLHYAMIARFGRFPHRNAVLRRKSRSAELRAVAAGNHW